MAIDSSDITDWERDEYLSAFKIYCIFQAIKLHFQKPDFSYAEYGPMTRYKFETFFANAGRRKQFATLSRRFDHYEQEKAELYIIATLMKNPKAYVPALLSKKAQSDYEELLQLYDNFSYNFGKQFEDVLLKRLDHYGVKFMQYLKQPQDDVGGIPYLMADLFANTYPMWFVVGLDLVSGFGDMYDKSYSHPFWADQYYLIQKVRELVPEMDLENTRQKIKDLCRAYNKL